MASSRDSSQVALIARVLRGEEGAFPLLLRPHERTVFLVARCLRETDHDAEVLAEQSVMTAFRNVAHVRSDMNFAAWLAQIVVRESGAYTPIANATEESITYMPRDFASWQEIPPRAVESQLVRKALINALTTLPPDLRVILVLRDVERFAAAEVAWILGAPEALIQARLLCARLQMRDALAPGLNGDWGVEASHPSKRTPGGTDEMRRNLA